MNAKSSVPKVFYGWFVVGATMVGLATGWSALFFTFGAFIQPLQETFGWQRAQISIGFSIVSLTAVFVSPLLGILVDKHGVRNILLPSVVMLGLVVASGYLLTANIWPLLSALARRCPVRGRNFAAELLQVNRQVVRPTTRTCSRYRPGGRGYRLRDPAASCAARLCSVRLARGFSGS